MARIRGVRGLLVLMRAAILLGAVRVALWTVSFRNLRRVVDSLTRGHFWQARSYSADQFSWAVRVASRYVPSATCLSQALVLHILLRRQGLQSIIRIGVEKHAEHFAAHAWVESRDRVVIGDRDLQRYTPMMVWE